MLLTAVGKSDYALAVRRGGAMHRIGAYSHTGEVPGASDPPRLSREERLASCGIHAAEMPLGVHTPPNRPERSLSAPETS